jgi:hypothetical protein
MAKRQRNQAITVAFNYLVKSMPSEGDPDGVEEEGFSEDEFARILNRLRDTRPLDEANPVVIDAIKLGQNLPFNYFEEVNPGLYFGNFDGAYYGQRYRNNRLGVVEAADLNLRGFHYLITRLRDGKILIGTTYHGLYGDYDGLRSCFSHLLRGNYRIASKTLKSVSAEIGNGQPVSLKLVYRKAADRPERRALFGSAGAIAISASEYGDGFGEKVAATARRVRGDTAQRKKLLAQIVKEDHMLSLEEDEIVGCSAIIREDGRQRTIYLIGENNFSTKFFLDVAVDVNGLADRDRTRDEMVKVLREKIMPMMR